MARSFNGTTDYVELGTGIRGADVRQLFVASWIWLNTNNTEHTVIGRWDNTLSESWLLTITNLGKAEFVILATDSNAYGAIGATTVTTGAWHHVGGSYDGATVRVYLDGTLDASNTVNKTMNNGLVTCRIGQHASSAFMDGQMAEVNIWLDNDNEAEFMTALWLGASPSDMEGLSDHDHIGYWPLLGDSPEPDLTKNQHNGTLHGTTVTNHPPIRSCTAFQ